MNALQELLAEGDTAVTEKSGKLLDTVQWLLVAAALFVGLTSASLNLGNLGTIFLVSLVVMFVHGTRRYGWGLVGAFLAANFLVSNLFENTSILWGYPFGSYHYTIGPKIFQVPVTVGIFYTGMGYLCWQTANVLLGFADRRLSKGIDVVMLPATAALLMTMFDLQVDPGAATIHNIWIWHHGGGYYGVPYTNFLGWWIVTYSFFQIFALALRASSRPLRPRPRSFWVVPVILYLNLGIPTAMSFLLGHPGAATSTDQAGRVWTHAEIFEGTFTVMVFTLLAMTVLALAQLLRASEEEAPIRGF